MPTRYENRLDFVVDLKNRAIDVQNEIESSFYSISKLISFKDPEDPSDAKDLRLLRDCHRHIGDLMTAARRATNELQTIVDDVIDEAEGVSKCPK